MKTSKSERKSIEAGITKALGGKQLDALVLCALTVPEAGPKLREVAVSMYKRRFTSKRRCKHCGGIL